MFGHFEARIPLLNHHHLGVFPTGGSLVAINCPETLGGGAEVASMHFGLVQLREVSVDFRSVSDHLAPTKNSLLN